MGRRRRRRPGAARRHARRRGPHRPRDVLQAVRIGVEHGAFPPDRRDRRRRLLEAPAPEHRQHRARRLGGDRHRRGAVAAGGDRPVGDPGHSLFSSPWSSSGRPFLPRIAFVVYSRMLPALDRHRLARWRCARSRSAGSCRRARAATSSGRGSRGCCASTRHGPSPSARPRRGSGPQGVERAADRDDAPGRCCCGRCRPVFHTCVHGRRRARAVGRRRRLGRRWRRVLGGSVGGGGGGRSSGSW